MTIKELIEKLKHFPQDSDVVIEYTDLTDYHYITSLGDDDINFREEISSDSFDWWIDDDEGKAKPEYENVLVITFRE
jgi:hypothetical protein